MGVLDGEGTTPSPNEAEESGEGTIAFSISLGTDRRETPRRSGTERRDEASDDRPDGAEERRSSERRADDERRTGPDDRRADPLFSLSLDGHDLDGERRGRAPRPPVDDFPLDDEDVFAQTLIEPLDPIVPTDTGSDLESTSDDDPDVAVETAAAAQPSSSPSVPPIPVLGAVEPLSSAAEEPAAATDTITTAEPDTIPAAEPDTIPAAEPDTIPAAEPSTAPAGAPETTGPAAPEPTSPVVSDATPPEEPTSTVPAAPMPEMQPIQPALVTTHRVPDQSGAVAARQEAARRAVLAANATVTPVRAVRRRSGSGFGLLFSLLVLAALIVGGIVFGRDLLFPGDWDDSAKSYADAVAVVRGVEYVDPFTVSVQPTAGYRPRVERQLLGEWEFDLPLWRAFGLAPGTVDRQAIAMLVDGRSPALYSHADGQIYVDEASSPFERDARITRAAVEASLDQEFGWSADHASRSLDDRALVDAHVGARAAVVQSASIYGDLVSAPPQVPVDSLPAVLDYRLTAPLAYAGLLPLSVTSIDLAGGSIDATGAPIPQDEATTGDPSVDPLDGMGDGGPGPVFQEPYDDASDAVLAEGDATAGARLQLDPAIWFMSFASHTDAATADRMTDAMTAASVHPVINGGVRCWLTTFGTNPTMGSTFVDGLTGWAAAAGPTLSASVSFLPDGSPQLRTCDPGPAFESQASSGLARQLIAYRATELAAVTAMEANGITDQLDTAEALERVKAAGVAERAAALPPDTNPAEVVAQIDAEVAALLVTSADPASDTTGEVAGEDRADSTDASADG